MNFNKPIKRRKLKTYYTRKKTFSKKKSSKWILKIIIYIILFFIILGFLMLLVLYTKYIKDLPNVSEMENIELTESSIFYDRDWKELYKFFTEKRTYVDFDEINKNMINAIVAWEDKRYWENPWVDFLWMVRAWVYYITWRSNRVWWTSTLTQQLIRNTILTNERSVERKVKEMYLAYRLTAWTSKEKILELYLNKISYWHNAYGIEEASKTFFWKQAIDLNILESSILASLPKWPTYYSLYNNPTRVLWYVYSFNKETPEEQNIIISKKDVDNNKIYADEIISIINNLKWNWIEWTDRTVICWVNSEDFKTNYSIDNEWCLVLRYSDLLMFLNNIQVEVWESLVEYQTWRKDFILWRMLEDWYINFDEYKESLISSIWFTFNQNKENINSPHFVFYVKEYLEEKYWQDIVSLWWLKVYTTLDSDLQKKADELVKKQVATNSASIWAKNWALISIDNKTWDILAMVWSSDYFNEENRWNVNIVTSKLQPWSSFKPFVYALALFNSEIWTKTPVYDLETTFPWNYTPKNYEWGFMWKMNISSALNYSRNIPAIKMFFLAWWESNIISFMQRLWVKSLASHGQYWAPLALWTWEMTPLELASAYTVFANLWEKVEINPILKIVDSRWNIIEEKKETKKEKIISEAQSYIINSIMSDVSTRPANWSSYLSLNNRPAAVKTGTSNKEYIVNWKRDIFPWNLWTAWFTPQVTTVVWAWNTDWARLWRTWNWLVWAAPIWRDYMNYAHRNKSVENWSKPKDVIEISISEISWLLPNPENVWNNITVNSLFINKPSEYDNSFRSVKVDMLCNWIVNENTPQAAIKNATLVQFRSLNPSNTNWENPVQEWAKSDSAKEKYWNIPNLITSINNNICERWNINNNILVRSNIINNYNYSVWENYIEIAYRSNNEINLLEIFFDWELIKTIDTEWKKEWSYSWDLFIASKFRNKNVEVEIRASDKYFFSSSEKNNIEIWQRDNNNPEITIENPSNNSIKLFEGEFFNLRASIFDTSKVETIININWIEYKNLWNNRRITLAINEDWSLWIWNHLISIITVDIFWNKSEKNIDLEIMKR